MPRILNDPEGWRRSSFANTWQPAAADNDSRAIQGVLIHGGPFPLLGVYLGTVNWRGVMLEEMVMSTSEVYSGRGKGSSWIRQEYSYNRLGNVTMEQFQD